MNVSFSSPSSSMRLVFATQPGTAQTATRVPNARDATRAIPGERSTCRLSMPSKVANAVRPIGRR